MKILFLALWLQMSAPQIPPMTGSCASCLVGTMTNANAQSKPPEPVDVPAVQEPTKEYPYICKTMPTCPAGEMCDLYYYVHHPNGGMSTISGRDEAKAWQVPDCPTTKTKRYSCADKSRVLLTSENGKKHCIKF